MKDKAISFFAGMLFMIVFGFIDNLFLIIGMDINPFLDASNSPMLSAMWGNTFSDVIGAIFGVIIASIFKRLFSVKPSEHLLVEMF
jgi:hypothetical protein